HALGLRREVRERGERVGAPRLGGPHGGEAELLRGDRPVHPVRRGHLAPVPELQSELHVRLPVRALGPTDVPTSPAPAYLPWKFGVRFSLKARGPSLASSDAKTSQP